MVKFRAAPELYVSPKEYNCKKTLSASITTETSCWVKAVSESASTLLTVTPLSPVTRPSPTSRAARIRVRICGSAVTVAVLGAHGVLHGLVHSAFDVRHAWHLLSAAGACRLDLGLCRCHYRIYFDSVIAGCDRLAGFLPGAHSSPMCANLGGHVDLAHRLTRRGECCRPRIGLERHR